MTAAPDTFLAVFTGSKTSPRMQAWFALPEAERKAKEKEGFHAWKAWVQKHARRDSSSWAARWARPNQSATDGIADISNNLSAFMRGAAPTAMRRRRRCSRTIPTSPSSPAKAWR